MGLWDGSLEPRAGSLPRQANLWVHRFKTIAWEERNGFVGKMRGFLVKRIMRAERDHLFEPRNRSRDLTGGQEFGEMGMSEAPDFRTWAARVARQAGKEPDTKEARRLMSIAEYWVKLAEIEDWQRNNPIRAAAH
jgi:hypothetical protein